MRGRPRRGRERHTGRQHQRRIASSFPANRLTRIFGKRHEILGNVNAGKLQNPRVSIATKCFFAEGPPTAGECGDGVDDNGKENLQRHSGGSGSESINPQAAATSAAKPKAEANPLASKLGLSAAAPPSTMPPATIAIAALWQRQGAVRGRGRGPSRGRGPKAGVPGRGGRPRYFPLMQQASGLRYVLPRSEVHGQPEANTFVLSLRFRRGLLSASKTHQVRFFVGLDAVPRVKAAGATTKRPSLQTCRLTQPF